MDADRRDTIARHEAFTQTPNESMKKLCNRLMDTVIPVSFFNC